MTAGQLPRAEGGNAAALRSHLGRLLQELERLPPEVPVAGALVLNALRELLAEALGRGCSLRIFAERIGLVEEAEGPSAALSLRISRLLFFAAETGQLAALLPPLLEALPERATEVAAVSAGCLRARWGGSTVAPPAARTGLEEPRGLPAHGPALSLAELRLDAALPRPVYVGRPFRLAVAVRLPTSPVLVHRDLDTVESGDVLFEWPDDAASRLLRLQVDAPDCHVAPPARRSFRVFAQRDGPLLYFLLTPQKAGEIAIVVTLYAEDAELEPLGAAGLNTKALFEAPEPTAHGARDELLAGAVEIHVHSQSLSRLTQPHIVAGLQPLHALLTTLLAWDADLPLRLAQRALLDLSRIERSNVLADQWWLVLAAAHNADSCAALVDEAANEIPERAGDLRLALAAYSAARPEAAHPTQSEPTRGAATA